MVVYGQLDQLLQEYGAQSTYNAAMFFKTEPGSYGAHDKFLGIRNPVLRQVAKKYRELSLEDVTLLLQSSYNEYRLVALFILVDRYQRSDNFGRDRVYQFYMDHIDRVNNWNLVDSSAHLIVGAHLYNGRIDQSVLDGLVNSPNLWRRRIAIVATWYHIRKNSLDLTLQLGQSLLDDQHDLIHKAAGWMLRELGKKDEQRLRGFLEQYRSRMPRTMLRYAIERLSDKVSWLKR